MPSPPDDQTITIRRGEDAVIPFAPAEATPITGWSLAFNVSTTPGAAVATGFPLTVGSGITVTSAADGTFTVVIPKSVTKLLTSGGQYFWDVWRTDLGSETPLGSGKLAVKEPVRPPS